MGRDKTIALSAEEKEALDTIREQMYGTTSVPYGEVLMKLIEESNR